MPVAKKYVYNVKFVCGTQNSSLENQCEAVVNGGVYSTEINIFNYDDERRASIQKFVVPLVIDRKITREPKYAKVAAIDKIVLPPNCATLDDCCRINELLKNQPGFKIGFLKIVSNIELEVTAVYTATGKAGEAVCLEVLQVQGRSN